VTGCDEIGGFVGSISHGSTITSCYSTGNVIGTGIDFGGFVGSVSFASVTNSFWDTEASGLILSAGGTGKTTTEMHTLATYTDTSSSGLDKAWDFVGNYFDDMRNDDFWDIDNSTNDGYPFLTSMPVSNSKEIVPLRPLTEIQSQNFPNPFNPTTTISFSIPQQSLIEIAVYNTKGQKVKSLLKKCLNKGNHSVDWNGDDNTGKNVASGVYFYKLRTGHNSQIKKMLLLK